MHLGIVCALMDFLLRDYLQNRLEKQTEDPTGFKPLTAMYIGSQKCFIFYSEKLQGKYQYDGKFDTVYGQINVYRTSFFK